jgi:hypothetical protein
MLRFLAIAAVLGAIGACTVDVAERAARLETQRQGVATNTRDRIAAFIAMQREADARICVDEGLVAGSVDHESCMRARADARRDAQHGPGGDAFERAATGRCWNPQFRRRLACLDV